MCSYKEVEMIRDEGSTLTCKQQVKPSWINIYIYICVFIPIYLSLGFNLIDDWTLIEASTIIPTSEQQKQKEL